MNYNEFINNILETRGRFVCGEEYHERHHIIPRCMGGTNDEENLIDLFAREHFEAHRLLALENPDNSNLIYAWNMMFVQLDNGERYKPTAEEYEKARLLVSEKKKKDMVGNTNRKGTTTSEEGKKNIGNAKRGKKHKGTPHTEETKQKISESRKGKGFHTEEWKKNMSIAMKDKMKGNQNGKGNVGKHSNKGQHWTLVNGRRIYFTDILEKGSSYEELQ